MKTAIFIDGAYLDKVLEFAFDQLRIDFGRFVDAINPEPAIRTYYYHCPPFVSREKTPQEIQRLESKERFFRALSRIPYFEVRLGRLVYRGKNENGQPIFLQKLVDVMLSVDMVQLAATKQIERVVLVAGDNDFLPAIEATKRLGVSTCLVYGPPTQRCKAHTELLETVDQRLCLNGDLIRGVIR